MAAQLRTQDEQAQSLANYLPGGRLFVNKNIRDSNFRKLLVGLAGELFIADGYLRSYQENIIPDETVLFIEEWEQALGIPDDCFSGQGSQDNRRLAILVKLASLGVQTADDFIVLASLFGVAVTIGPGISFSTFPLTFPWLFFGTSKEARFTIVVDFTVVGASVFPLEFPFTFGTKEIGILECLFSKLKPSNCDIIFRQV